MKGRSPTADEKRYMVWVASKGCYCCNILGIDNRLEDVGIHHINGKTKPDAHYQVIGLCDGHHSRYKRTGLHYNQARWEEEWGNHESIVAALRDEHENL